MTTNTLAKKSAVLEQKRIDNMQWSSLSGSSNLPTDNQADNTKSPLFYLDIVSIDHDKSDVYFVNNTDETLSFAAPYELMATDAECPEVMVAANPNAPERALTYTQILPYQGVRVARQPNTFAGADLNPFIMYTMSRSSKEMWGVWRFHIAKKELVNKRCPLLWSDINKPNNVIDAKKVVDPKERPLLPPVLPIRTALYEQWCDTYDRRRARLMVAVTDVIYRYDFGIIGCYYNDMWDEFSSEAAHLVELMIQKDAGDPDDVLTIMIAVYDAAFGKGMTKIPLVVAETIYHLWLRHKRWGI